MVASKVAKPRRMWRATLVAILLPLRPSHGTWGAILSSVKCLKHNGIDLLALCIRKIGNGALTSFWNDTWSGGILEEVKSPLNLMLYFLLLGMLSFLVKRILGCGRLTLLLALRDETWFSESERGRGRGVKEKHIGLSNDLAKNVGNDEANDTSNVVCSAVDESVAKNLGSNDVNTPIVNMEKPLKPNMGAHINDIANVEVSATCNSTPITSASITESVSFAAKLKGDLTRKSVTFRTLVAPAGNEANVCLHHTVGVSSAISKQFAPIVKFHDVLMIAFTEDGLSIIATKLSDEELKDTIMVAMPKLGGDGFNLCTILSDVVMNNPIQDTRVVLVGPKVSFKSTKQIYKPISNKNDANNNGKKKQGEVFRKKCVDDDGNPLVPMGNVDSNSEVEVVFDETVNLMASMSFKDRSDRGYDTCWLLCVPDQG
ncbi:hypothetical protein Tco_0111261 [Tanacetum coccineum]